MEEHKSELQKIDSHKEDVTEAELEIQEMDIEQADQEVKNSLLNNILFFILTISIKIDKFEVWSNITQLIMLPYSPSITPVVYKINFILCFITQALITNIKIAFHLLTCVCYRHKITTRFISPFILLVA